jgi:surface antigen Omp85-like protein
MRLGLALFVMAVLAAASSHGQDVERKTAVAGAQYKKGGFHRFFFGDNYRDVWATPVAVEVLDLQHEAGGLSPAFRVGGQETHGLAMAGKDGRNYTFRGVDKNAADLLPDEQLKGTVVESMVADAMSGQHPGSELIARGLLEAAGVRCWGWRLVVMPDDPALGEFRADFAGLIGTFAEYPSAKSATNPGTWDITEIVDHLELFKRIESGDGERADYKALLKARLLDIMMGDWDRHRKQWRWARFAGSDLWEPIPEDRDQAFSRYEGMVATFVRTQDGRFQDYGPEYHHFGGLTWNGQEQDRRLLVGLQRSDFAEAAAALKAALTDDKIDAAVRLLPPEWYAKGGARLASDIKARRNGLPRAAMQFYERLADDVDVYMSNRDDLAEAKRLPNGDLDVRVSLLGPDGRAAGEPYYSRVFHPKETHEVRLYGLGGNDRFVVTGGQGSIKVRAIGGDGDDVLDDRQGGGSRLSDAAGRHEVLKGPGTSIDTRLYVPPPPDKNAPWVPPVDFGKRDSLDFVGHYNQDIGVYLGGWFEIRTFGFREDPYSTRHVFSAGYSTSRQNGRFSYRGIYRRENRSSYYGFALRASGIDVLRFYGFGNATSQTGNEDFYKVDAKQVAVYPSFTAPVSQQLHFTIGPILRYTDTAQTTDQFINASKPYGTGKFGEAGLAGGLVADTRDNTVFPRRGIRFALRSAVYPATMDVTSTFGNLSGELSGYATGGPATLALRVGGKRVFGAYPYFEAAAIGGPGPLAETTLEEPSGNVRGFPARRYAGDGSLFGNAELRLRLFPLTIVIPGHLGILGFADSGRVFLSGDAANAWHTGYGGGLWLSFLNDIMAVSVAYGHSKEDDAMYFKGGFSF